MKASRNKKSSPGAIRKAALAKLPGLARQIEHNATSARRFVRRAFTLLVTVESAGPGPFKDAGGDVEQELNNILAQELDRAIDYLQGLIDQQQEVLGNSLGGGGGQGGKGDSDEKRCATFLQQYQAALKLKDYAAAQGFLAKYSACEARRPVVLPVNRDR